MYFDHRRREFLKALAAPLLLVPSLQLLTACNHGTGGKQLPQSNLDNLGVLKDPDANGVRLPEGFTSRIVATSGQPAWAGSGYGWHAAPDGGATFATDDGGWIYVSNSELNGGLGGVGAIRFDSNAQVIDSYSILDGTSRNCAGGASPWGTWFSCEEIGDASRVFECDPFGRNLPIELPSLGRFNHEAVAYDLLRHQIYLTEDRPDGLLYRYTPRNLTSDGFADLSDGTLEAAEIVDAASGLVAWRVIPDPLATMTPTRFQIANVSIFNGGEGIDYHGGVIYFVTKGDNRVWTYDADSQTIDVLYDDDESDTPILTGVDNLTTNSSGDILVAEDGGDLQIVVLTRLGNVTPLMQLVGHNSSEIAGPAFTPGGARLYFSSQRGTTGRSQDGITFEISGPFFV